MKKAKVKTVKAKARPTTKRRVRVGSGSTADRPPVERSHEEKLRDQLAALGGMARAINASRDAQARRDWEMNKKYENEPMVGEAVWHVHRR